MAITGGRPSRPPSAVTTPATVTTVPTGTARASTIVIVGGAVGPGVGVGFIVGATVGAGENVGCGVGVGADVGWTVGTTVGAAVGAAVGGWLGYFGAQVANSDWKTISSAEKTSLRQGYTVAGLGVGAIAGYFLRPKGRTVSQLPQPMSVPARTIVAA